MMSKWRMPATLAPLVCAAMLGGCGGSDGQVDDRRAATQGGATQAAAGTPEAPAAALVSLSGCLEAAPGTQQYVLRNVRFEPRSAGDPHGTTTTTGGVHGLTEGAWVRLDGTDRPLNDHLGQRVVVKGVITDDGRNTIGTAGAPGVQTPTGDRSQAASPEHHADKQKKEMGRIARESMADGTAAKVRVQDLTPTGERCVPAQSPR